MSWEAKLPQQRARDEKQRKRMSREKEMARGFNYQPACPVCYLQYCTAKLATPMLPYERAYTTHNPPATPLSSLLFRLPLPLRTGATPGAAPDPCGLRGCDLHGWVVV